MRASRPCRERDRYDADRPDRLADLRLGMACPDGCRSQLVQTVLTLDSGRYGKLTTCISTTRRASTIAVCSATAGPSSRCRPSGLVPKHRAFRAPQEVRKCSCSGRFSHLRSRARRRPPVEDLLGLQRENRFVDFGTRHARLPHTARQNRGSPRQRRTLLGRKRCDQTTGLA
jgi:hypothetical protein